MTLAEYVKHMYGETKNVADWDSAGLQFRTYRDHNKDGFIDKDELMLWIHPKVSHHLEGNTKDSCNNHDSMMKL